MIELARSSGALEEPHAGRVQSVGVDQSIGLGEMGVVQPLPITWAEPSLDMAHGPFARTAQMRRTDDGTDERGLVQPDVGVVGDGDLQRVGMEV